MSVQLDSLISATNIFRHPYIRPVTYIALTIVIVTHSNDSAISFQSDRVIASSRDGNNIRPIGYTALTVKIAPCGNYSAVGFEPDCVT